ncbi:MAG: TIGR03000 domain-containing protein [Gemmataceae bacterium]|nr:TIGR03000 domain-containing protein [Gemmataceae bacterium]
MYSMVLMAALVGGTEAPDFGHRGCRGWGCHGGYSGCYNGCYNGYGCSGYGGCWCNGYGGYGGGYGCVGCFANGYQGCYSGYTATGWACYACQGGNFAGWCYGGGGYGGGMISCHGCYGAYGGCSCYGVSPYHPTMPMYPPGPPAGGKEPEKIGPPGKKGDGKDGKDGDEVSNRARLVVELPTDAKLYIDDQQMKTNSARRVFNTPPLELGQTYYYVLRAEVVRDGQTRSETQRVLLRPGQEIRASFSTLDTAPTATAQR